MFDDSDHDDFVYRVVVNGEEQYSIWLADTDVPPGWRDTGITGNKAECLAHISTVWVDMRPLSLRGGSAGPASASLASEGWAKPSAAACSRPGIR